ncbi:MAG: peptidyl-tRNA hydrolase [Candidatus Saccharibacteria bacterium]|nr:peptidyl-tRNA hydrolase [Candidatus Saccharibacteria bacterium]
MALFQRRPQAGDTVQYYSAGNNRTLLLVGLGNPGKEYDLTRHNVGFACLDAFVAKNADMADWINKKDLKCLVSSGQVGDNRVIAIKPTTFMNLSGEAVLAAANFYKIPLEQTVVVYDELDIEFGQIRLRVGGSSAGHNGVKSVSKLLGEDYGRVRIGIGPKTPARMATADFVLQKFSAEQQAQLPNLTKEVNAILSEFVYGTEQLPAETRTFLI